MEKYIEKVVAMKINFSDLLSKKIRRKKVEQVFNLDEFTFENEKMRFLAPVNVNGEISCDKDIVTLNLHIETQLELKCSRCLENFSHNVSFDMEEKFTNNKINESDEEDEITFVNSDILDIAEIVENNIISTLPIKRLCKEECKGLCHVCGANLNLSKCECIKDNIDERFAALKDFFTK